MIAATNAAREVLCVLISVYTMILLIRVILSWAVMLGWRPPYSGVVRKGLDLLDDVTEPLLKPLRSLIPPVRAGGVGLDVSILVAFVILAVLRMAICR
jgi:YggT family protein